MKKVLALIMSAIMAMGLSVTAFAAKDVIELGSDDFGNRVDSSYTVVSKTVKEKKETYKITGYYYASEGKEVLKIMNAERKKEGLPALAWETTLVQPAIQRALEQHLKASHTRPNGSDWSTVSNLANGENLAGGDDNAEDVMEGWMNSPSHRENILDKDFTSVAVACVETEKNVYWVQLFHADTKKSSSTQKSDDTEESSSKADTSKADTSTKTTAASSGSVTAKSLTASLDKAKVTAETASLSLKYANADKLSVDALQAAAKWGTANKKTVSITVSTPSASGKSTQGQLTLNPASFVNNKNALKTGVYVDTDSSVAKKYKDAKVIKFDQTGSFGGSVYVGAKVNLTGLNTKNLMFYHYDSKTGKATKLDIGKAGYTVDKNNYLRFNTTKGGYIIVTDKAL